MAHRAQIVDLVGLDVAHQIGDPHAIGQVAVVQVKMRIFMQVLDAAAVERGGAAHQPVDVVSLAQEQLGQIGAVLSGDAGDECSLHIALGFLRGLPPTPLRFETSIVLGKMIGYD